MSAARQTDELFRFMREREQALAGSDRYHLITVAMHDKQRRSDPCDALIGAELITT